KFAVTTSGAPDRPRAPGQPASPGEPRQLPGAVGRFRVQGRLGSGGFGTVYRAHDPELDRDVALKVPHPEVVESPRRLERFLREAKAAARLRHPHLVPVYDAGRDGGCYYVALAFVAGTTLADAVDAGPLEARRAARLAREVAEALAYAHG